MSVIETIERISTDFDEGNPPFDNVEFPEERLLDVLPNSSMEDRAALVSIFATFDYNRDASQLVDNLIDLHETHQQYFEATRVPLVKYEDELAAVLEEVGFRYPNRDAHAWSKNCQILSETYHGRWTELLLSVGADAPSLVERLRDDDFLVMKGDKVAPMYARIIDDEVCSLDGVWDLEIPVDTHIRRLSKRLFSDIFNPDDLTDDMIREEWRGLAVEADIDRSVVDGALWHIGNKWNGWGEDYWNEVTE